MLSAAMSSNQLMTSTFCPLMFTLSPQLNMSAEGNVLLHLIMDRLLKLYPIKRPTVSAITERVTVKTMKPNA